jgi:hypothetical protein
MDLRRGTPELRETLHAPCFDIDAVDGLLESPRLENPYATHPLRLAHAADRGGDLGISPRTRCAATTAQLRTGDNACVAGEGRVGAV